MEPVDRVVETTATIFLLVVQTVEPDEGDVP